MVSGFIRNIQLEGIGPVWIAQTERGVSSIAFGGSRSEFVQGLDRKVKWRRGKDSKAGSERKKAAIGDISSMKPHIPGGTAFQRSVWKAISSIPRGETRSYAWVARKAGRPRAARAAANACGANPVPIIIPCHRVIASDGSLGGFSPGPAVKRKLLALEGYRF